MRHEVDIQSDRGSQDSYGQTDTDWKTDICTKARIKTLRGAEGELAKQIYPNATVEVTIDYYEELADSGATQRRLCFGSRVLNIGAIINPDEENVQLELLCGEER